MIAAYLILGTVWLAWSNGANDNFKGVATLYGSRTSDYRTSLAWASVTTFLGSLVAVLLAQGLVRTFSGQGMIAAHLMNDSMLASVGLAAAGTILLATILGMPTSTTHAMTGALVGSALMAGPDGINTSALLARFAQPLLLSPLIAIALTAVLYSVLHRVRKRTGITSDFCACVGSVVASPALVPTGVGRGMLAGDPAWAGIELRTGTREGCVERYRGCVVGVDAQSAVNVVHYLSAGAVCFARAVNDTPKIAALILSAGAIGATLSPQLVILMVTTAVVAGGIVQGRRVARTMSCRITELNCGQGVTANLVTASLVLVASRLGMPVSTTHVSCGAIFGIGAVNGRRNWRTIGQILLAWATTLPLGMALGAGTYGLLRSFGG